MTSYLGRVVTVFVGKLPGKKGALSAYTGFFRKGSDRIPVYIVGLSERPGPKFTGRVVAMIYDCTDDREICRRPDAMVLAPTDTKLNQAEIAELIFTKEEAARHRIEPLFHKSCGAIVYRKGENGLEFLILNEQHSEKWGFPKGHMEHSESEEDTARREIFEEAGFRPSLIDDFREEIHYRISATGEKSVIYFLSEYDGPVHVRKNEISDYAWITADNARQYLHRSNLIRMIEKANRTVLDKTDREA